MAADAHLRVFFSTYVRLTLGALFGATLALAPMPGLADHIGDDGEPDDAAVVQFGEREFMSNCASCHNVTGKGYGPYLQHLADGEYVVPALPDLTMLSRMNNGQFPSERIHEVIDGRAELKAHGPRDMPIWGNEYGMEAVEYYRDVFHVSDVENIIADRIKALVTYLERLQEE